MGIYSQEGEGRKNVIDQVAEKNRCKMPSDHETVGGGDTLNWRRTKSAVRGPANALKRRN